MHKRHFFADLSVEIRSEGIIINQPIRLVGLTLIVDLKMQVVHDQWIEFCVYSRYFGHSHSINFMIFGGDLVTIDTMDTKPFWSNYTDGYYSILREGENVYLLGFTYPMCIDQMFYQPKFPYFKVILVILILFTLIAIIILFCCH